MRRVAFTVAILGIGALGACTIDRTIGINQPDDGGAAVLDMATWRPSVDLARAPAPDLSPNSHSGKVDFLFMVDDSNSMAAMQDVLARSFVNLHKFLLAKVTAEGRTVDVNLGVVTSDYGAGTTGAPGCQPSPGGKAGRLQAIGAGAKQGCLPPVGANFIHAVFAPNPNGWDPKDGENNLPPGQDFEATFACMSAVGAQGCGFEHQLESVHAALHNNIPENKGFLRDDALLVVVFVTNEDDASASPATDVFDRNKAQQYGYEDSYSRQTRFAIVCGPDPGAFPPYADSNGPLSNCRPAPNPNASENYAGDGPGKQYDVSRYIDFFTKPRWQGGVKDDPLRVILASIAAPADPVTVILGNPATPAGQSYLQCGQLNENSTPPCVPLLQHSCTNPQRPVLFGDPAVRLSAVVNAVQLHTGSSICDGDYGDTMVSIAKIVDAYLGL